jgi:FtsP/CotA-like multicopper oxidase with cupredoxin domain
MYDYDQIIMLQDWYHDLSPGLVQQYLASGNENAEPVPDNGLIQGTNYFNCSSYDSNSGYQCADNSTRQVFAFIPNKRYRLRFINTGAFTPFQMSVDNHTMEVIEADGTLTNNYPIHRLEIAVAERYSVIIHTNQSSSSNYWIRGLMNENCYAASNPVLDPNVLAILTYTNSSATPTNSVDWPDVVDVICQDLNNTLLSPSSVEQAPPADILYDLQFSFEIGAYALDRAFVNGTSWSPDALNPTLNQAVNGLKSSNASSFEQAGLLNSAFSPNQLVMSVPTAQVVDLLVLNFDDGSHPFHLHGHVFWVMATSADQYFPWDTDLYSQLNSTTPNSYNTNPMRRDTLVLPAYSWAMIRFNADNAGMWAFHCHNTWHMEAGLFTQFLVMQDVVKARGLPDDVVALCNV